MSNKDAYEAKLETLAAIPGKAIKVPRIPISVFLQECENLHHWVQEDKEELIYVSLDWAYVTDLPLRMGALRYAEALWNRASAVPEDLVKQAKQAYEEAVILRKLLVREFRFAFAKRPRLLAAVRRLGRCRSQAKLIGDLSDLTVLARKHTALLSKTGFDLAKLEEAAEVSSTLGGLLAGAQVARKQGQPARAMRDRAYTHLKEAVDEIRRCGHHAFHDNPERREGYVSQYYRKSNNDRGPKAP